MSQINPIWLYGPFKADAVSTAAQPDWYMGWIEGALRIMPPSLVRLGPYSVSELFWPAVLLPGITFGMLYLWPFIERKVTGDNDEHHLLDRPSERPVRTALGVVVLTFYFVLLLAGGQDIWAQELDLPLPTVLWSFRIIVFVVPILFGLFTWKLCHDLEAARHAEREEALAEPPVAPNEPPDEPGATDTLTRGVSARRGRNLLASALRRITDTVTGLVVLAILGHRGRRARRSERRDQAERSDEVVRR